MADLCVSCDLVVRPRQEALQCDSYHGWQHRTCGTTISRDFYRRLVKKEVTLEKWLCCKCHLPSAVSNFYALHLYYVVDFACTFNLIQVLILLIMYNDRIHQQNLDQQLGLASKGLVLFHANCEDQ